MVGTAVIAQELPGEDDVRGRHRSAVREVRRRIQREGDIASRVVRLDRAREQAIEAAASFGVALEGMVEGEKANDCREEQDQRQKNVMCWAIPVRR